MIKVYSKLNCPACDEAKRILSNNGVLYEEVRIDQDQAAREFLVSQGFRTVPQMFKDGVVIENGITGLKAMTPEQVKLL